MSEKGSILVIDDEEVMRDVLRTLLGEAGYGVSATATAREGLEELRERMHDLVLLDLMLPDMDGFAVLDEIQKIDPNIVTLIITAYGTTDRAFEAAKRGAFGFIAKPFKNEEVLLLIENGLQRRRLVLENLQLKRSFQERFAYKNIIGKSEGMQRVFNLIRQVGPSRSTVLIAGESGTGKELVAKAIHSASPRADKPFVTVNCSNIPAELLESELFGHVKGAFTGALTSKKGLFEVADTGSIFLDEVGIIPLEIQSKLLRVIQEREFRRLGGIDNIKVDVRIIAATNIDLQRAVEENRFREDLYYRLNVITINLPPLRDRREDIPLLVEHFVARFCAENGRPACTVAPDALKILIDYNWPGNVRELENVIERAVVMLGDREVITADMLPREMLADAPANGFKVLIPSGGISLKEEMIRLERNYILEALRRSDWNQKKAARLLNLNPTTLNEKMKRLNIRESQGS